MTTKDEAREPVGEHKCLFCGEVCPCKLYMMDDPLFEGQVLDDFDCIGCLECRGEA